MAKTAHQLVTREEFGEMLSKSPRWKAILDDLVDRAYDDLQVNALEGVNDLLLTAVAGIRGQHTDSVRLFHLNFLVKEIQNVDESGNG